MFAATSDSAVTTKPLTVISLYAALEKNCTNQGKLLFQEYVFISINFYCSTRQTIFQLTLKHVIKRCFTIVRDFTSRHGAGYLPVHGVAAPA